MHRFVECSWPDSTVPLNFEAGGLSLDRFDDWLASSQPPLLEEWGTELVAGDSMSCRICPMSKIKWARGLALLTAAVVSLAS